MSRRNSITVSSALAHIGVNVAFACPWSWLWGCLRRVPGGVLDILPYLEMCGLRMYLGNATLMYTLQLQAANGRSKV